MLLEFKVTNFRSFKDTQALSLAASRYYREMEEENTIESGLKGLPRLVRSAAVYGPNASGKSNLIAAMSVMRSIILSSAKETQEGEPFFIAPFLLDSEGRFKETTFEIAFIEDGIRYQYGFSINRERVIGEWLIAYPGGKPQRWFERTFDAASGQYAYEFSTRFLGGRLRQEWRKATRGNALYLSVAVQFNSEQLKPVFLWFQKKLRIIMQPFEIFEDYTTSICKTEDGKRKVLNFLNRADLSIVDVRIDTKKFSEDDLPKNWPVELKELSRKIQGGKDIDHITFFHKDTRTGDLVPFGIVEESHGTLNLFRFAGPWFDVLSNDKILLVDEIENSLHPLIVHELIKLLHRSGSKAQLIFTTHDTTILSQEIMRRDQVWFIEKDKENASKLYPLSDFKVRGKEAIERGYLMGRYGAIPYIEEFIVHE